MRRSNNSDNEDYKRFVIEFNRNENRLMQRKRRLYNRFFKKSLFYRSSLVVRLLYVLLFAVVFCFYKTSNGFKDEQFVKFEIEYEGGGKYARDTYYLTTTTHTYVISRSFVDYKSLQQGDIIKVEHNIFGKPIYFKKDDWTRKYGIYKNYIYYYMLLFATCLTFFFKDGLDYFTNKLLYVFYAIDLISIIAFFII